MSKQFDCKNRDKYLEMPIEEKRKLYKCSNDYVTIEQIDIIKDQLKTIALDSKISESHKINTLSIEEAELFGDKISLWKGDITKLEVDSIVNAANERLLGGQGVDGAIHRGAGKLLLEECRSLHGCKTGHAKLTGGYNLPSKYVIHTVGPIGERPNMLKSCYKSCLELMKANNLLTIAFPCVSTGVFGYPNESAALVAIETVLEFLRSDYGKSVDRIIFTLFLDKDVKIYESIMKAYFDAIN